MICPLRGRIPAKPLDPTAPRQPHQQCLELIIAMVGGGNHSRSHVLRPPAPASHTGLRALTIGCCP